MTRLWRAAVLASVGALAIPAQPWPSRVARITGNITAPSAPAPVLSLDGQRLAERVRISRSYERPQSPPVSPSPLAAAAALVIDAPKAGRRAITSPAAETRADRTQQRERPTALGRGAPSTVWARTLDAIRVANCESGDRHGTTYNGDPHLRGTHSGKWQMDADFWATYGGLQYAATAADATESEQDQVAHRGWLDRGWQPWTCARIMGVR